jgi:NAD-dependent dihydropyrimidine dehydrogenase PreA subunit
MKSILESTLKWFKGANVEEVLAVETEPASQPVVSPPPEETLVTTVTPVVTLVPDLVPVPPQLQVKPEPVIISFSTAPELVLKNKAGTVYATCPHCSATWNLRERLMRPRRTEVSNELTCPACEQPVSVRREALAK